MFLYLFNLLFFILKIRIIEIKTLSNSKVYNLSKFVKFKIKLFQNESLILFINFKD